MGISQLWIISEDWQNEFNAMLQVCFLKVHREGTDAETIFSASDRLFFDNFAHAAALAPCGPVRFKLRRSVKMLIHLSSGSVHFVVDLRASGSGMCLADVHDLPKFSILSRQVRSHSSLLT